MTSGCAVARATADDKVSRVRRTREGDKLWPSSFLYAYVQRFHPFTSIPCINLCDRCSWAFAHYILPCTTKSFFRVSEILIFWFWIYNWSRKSMQQPLEKLFWQRYRWSIQERFLIVVKLSVNFSSVISCIFMFQSDAAFFFFFFKYMTESTYFRKKSSSRANSTLTTVLVDKFF